MDVKVLADTTNSLSNIITGRQRWSEQRDALLTQCRELFGAEVCAVFLVREEKVQLDCHVGYTRADGSPIDLPLLQRAMTYRITPESQSSTGAYDGLTGYVASRGEEISIDHPAGLDKYKAEGTWKGKPDDLGIWDQKKKRGFRCLFAVPLKAEERTIGVLKVENKTDSQGNALVFDDVDKQVVRALGNLLSVAVTLAYFRCLPYDELFSTTMEWLERFDRRNLYQHMVEFCAELFQADVCALFVKTHDDQGDELRLAAGRLPDGSLMSPKDFTPGKDPTYKVGKGSEGRYDGLTGRIVSKGEGMVVNAGELEARKHKSHRGRWDEVVWENEEFQSMVGVPLRVGGVPEPIGVLKLERAKSSGLEDFRSEDIDIVGSAAAALARHVQDLGRAGQRIGPEDECEYRLIRSEARTFSRKPIDEVVIRHLVTGICQSDVQYFKHEKEQSKLDRRLPMALGHETVGEILRRGPDARYWSTREQIKTGDQVFVIPQMHCGTCDICKGGYGENYCPSVKFMASNAPGSLRSVYPYDAGLVLKTPPPLEGKPELAVFTEPMANVVHLLEELGFQVEENRVELEMKPYDQHNFEFFHVTGARFSNVFNTVTEQEPFPRTLFVCRSAEGADVGPREVSQQSIMSKGLGVLGHDDPEGTPELIRTIENPRVLILGSGISSLLLALALVNVYQVDPGRICVTARRWERLRQFEQLVGIDGVNVRAIPDPADVVKAAKLRVGSSSFDLAFECVGGESVNTNLEIALDALRTGGVMAMFGLTHRPLRMDFTRVLSKRIFIKGSYRANLESYRKSLEYIANTAEIQSALESIIEDAHDIRDEQHLAEVFEMASQPRETITRIFVRQLHD